MEQILKKIKQLTLLIAAMFVFATSAFAAVTGGTPAYNTMISNQAALNYTGYDEESRSLLSNVVITYVDHLYSVLITPEASATVVPGQTAYFMHTVTNKGNGDDKIILTNDYSSITDYTVTYRYAARGTQVYDQKLEIANGTVPTDGSGNILPTLKAGESWDILVAVTTPNSDSLKGTTVDTKYIHATSKGDSTIKSEVKEIIHYTEHAAVQVYKGLDSYSGNRLTDKTIGVTFNIANTATASNAYATEFVLKDTLDSKFTFDTTQKVKYTAYDTAKTEIELIPNGSIQTVDSVDYSVTWDNTTRLLTFSAIGSSTHPAVPQNTKFSDAGGILKFNVVVKAGTAIGYIDNTGWYDYTDLGGTKEGMDTNTVTYDVLPTRKVTITNPTNSGVTYAGGFYTYSHIIKNEGDVIEGTGDLSSIFTLATSDDKTGWKSAIYLDVDHDGKYTPGTDTPISDFRSRGGLGVGDSIKIVVHVSAPADAQIGDLDVTKVLPVITDGVYHIPAEIYAKDEKTGVVGTTKITYVQESTLIKGDYLVIEKFQSVDAVDNNFTKNDKYVKPGNNIYYKIRVENKGDTVAKSVVISDSVPTYTTLASGTTKPEDNVVGIDGIPSYKIMPQTGSTPVKNWTKATISPGIGKTGDIVASVGDLQPGEVATLYFNVKVDYKKED